MERMYELTNSYKELQNMMLLAENEDDIMAIQDTLAMIDESIELKAENTAKFIAILTADNEGVTQELERLRKRKERQKKLIDMLKANLDIAMQVKGVKSLHVNSFTIGYRKSTIVNVLDLAAIPDEYKRTKVTVDADKTAIKQAINNKIDIPGAELVIKQNIQIK
ncbi:siphovirus Gp157 family protein [Veillonella intestinalis]|uniref:siphovirus Gp157 family protein n=1 Tax=Veillonella intestinalis TaxID=2941341 RepID=UPI00203E509A|nr:siphovirus Gp157 family protein [Veillonella intestinalis]